MGYDLFLTSSVCFVAAAIRKELPAPGCRLLNVITAHEYYPDDNDFINTDRHALSAAGFEVIDYTVTGKSKEELAVDLQSVDGVHIEGGNTFYLLQQFLETGFDQALKQRLWDKQPFMYIGTSAGSIVAGPEIAPVAAIDDRLDAPRLLTTRGLGLVDFVVVPHWGSDIFQDRYFNHFVPHAYHTQYPLVMLSDQQYARVDDEGSVVLHSVMPA